jgi:ABC-2 type transport system ATP-binding protein
MSDAAVVQMRGLYARDCRGAVLGLDLALPAGPIGALIGTPADGTTALARALCGSIRPSAGWLTVADQAPYSSPAIRSRIGVLLEQPDLPDVGTVRELFSLARGLRAGPLQPETWHTDLGLAELDPMPIARLSTPQARTVALGLALSVPSPSLLVLHEPLADLTRPSCDVLGPVLRARAQAGSCVLLLTASTSDAIALADDVATLTRGCIGRAIGKPSLDALTPDCQVQLRVWCSAPRTLASALSLESAVQAVYFSADDALWPLVIRAPQLDACAAAVWRAAAQRDVIIHSMRPTLPGTSDVNDATARIAASQGAHAPANPQPGRGSP